VTSVFLPSGAAAFLAHGSAACVSVCFAEVSAHRNESAAWGLDCGQQWSALVRILTGCMGNLSTPRLARMPAAGLSERNTPP